MGLRLPLARLTAALRTPLSSSPSSPWDTKNQPNFVQMVFIANEGLVKILYKCLVPINVFTEMKLLFPKQNYNVLSPSSYTNISVRDLHITRMGLPILLQGNMWTDPGNI
jgi:hypothetical protein